MAVNRLLHASEDAADELTHAASEFPRLLIVAVGVTLVPDLLEAPPAIELTSAPAFAAVSIGALALFVDTPTCEESYTKAECQVATATVIPTE